MKQMESDDTRLTEHFEIAETSFPPFYREKAKLISSLLEGEKIMEVGCGGGDLLRFLDYKNLDITGSDYSNVYLDKARAKNLPINLFKANLLDDKSWKEFKNNFDSIIASEVIEHIENHQKALKTIIQLLKPGGVLILTVPASPLIYSKYDKKIGHFRRYEKKSLKKILEEQGFSVEKIRYWNFPGFIGWLFNYKIFNNNPKSTMKPFLIRVLAGLLSFEKSIEMPLGLTLIVKARKNVIINNQD